MTITIKVDYSCKTLGEVHSKVNNALAARIRKLKKRGAEWPKVKFLGLKDGAAVYRVGA